MLKKTLLLIEYFQVRNNAVYINLFSDYKEYFLTEGKITDKVLKDFIKKKNLNQIIFKKQFCP